MESVYKNYKINPPPIKTVLEPLTDQNAAIPGEIQIDESGQLLKKYFEYEGVGEFIKEEFNLWIKKILPKQIDLGKITLKDGSYFKFENVIDRKPSMRDTKTNELIPLKPHYAHEANLSYLLEVYADRVHYNSEGQVIARFPNKPLCKLPAMVGSISCHLDKASKFRILQEYECIADPFGWFIVEGLDKVILLQEKLVTNRVVIFSDTKRGGLIAKMTCVTLRGSTIIHLIQAPQGQVKINLHFLGKEKSPKKIRALNVLSVFRILGISSLNQIVALIMQFTSFQKKVLIGLAATITEFSKIADDFEEIKSIIKGSESKRRVITEEGDANKDFKSDITNETIIKLLKNELFPHIPFETISIDNPFGAMGKLNMLAYMVARYVETIIGLRKMDDRDSWANKRIVGPARSMERLFGKAFHLNLDGIQEDVNNDKITTFIQISTEVDSMVGNISNQFITSFRGNNWGIKGSYSKENITDTLKRDSAIAMYAQLLRINTPTNRKAKQTGIRMPQGTQARFICIVETPEGSNCTSLAGTSVLLGNGVDSAKFDEIGEKSILSVNKDNFTTEATKIIKPFTLDTREKGEQLYEIVTLTGKKLTTTGDHPFLTKNGWTLAKDLNKDTDYVVIKHMYAPVSDRVEESVILDEHIFREGLHTRGIKDHVIALHCKVLVEKGLLPLRSTDKNLSVLARMYAALVSSGKMESDNNCFSQLIDVEMYQNDVKTLGFNCRDIEYSPKEQVYYVSNDSSLSALFIALCGNQNIKEIPVWVMEGSDHVKREFLAGLQQETAELYSQYGTLFTYFNIEDGDILNYMEKIGHRYSHTKLQNKIRVYEYLKYKQLNPESKWTMEEFLQVNPFVQDLQYQQIASIKRVAPDIVADFTTVSNNHSFVANGFVTHNCGIVKHVAITMKLSLERDDGPLMERIRSFIMPRKDALNAHPLLVNGRFEGWVKGLELKKYLLKLRRSGEIEYDTGIYMEPEEKGALYIFTIGERPLAPLLIVDEDTQELLYDKFKSKLGENYSFHTLLKMGLAEYLDPLEAEFSLPVWDKTRLADKKKDIQQMSNDLVAKQEQLAEILQFRGEMDDEMKKSVSTLKNEVELITTKISKLQAIRYTHCDIDPTSILGVSASLIPFLGHNQAPRDVLACAQNKQALSIYNSNQMYRFDKTSKSLAFPTRPLIETQMNSILGFDEIPAGDTAVVAIMPMEGYNQEDAFVFKKEAIDRGFMWYVKYMSYDANISDTAEYGEMIKKPTPKKGENIARYNALNEFGVARIGYPVKEGDYIIGKVRIPIRRPEEKDKPVVEENVSVAIGLGDEGVVERVLITFDDEGRILIKVKIRDVRKPEDGDKFTMRSAGQKGTIGRIARQEDLPRTIEGIAPDLIINPMCIPSRMTIGLPLEILISRAMALTGKRYNATAFRPRNYDEIELILKNAGYNRTGTEIMYSGTKGHEMQGRIFIGPAFYQSLRHHVKDKIQARGCGSHMLYTGQPNEGRARNGALRFGEQERDANISHGAARFLQERLCDVSDAVNVEVCITCGNIAIGDISRQEFSCLGCKDQAKFGRIRIPRVFNLILQLLQAANIKINLETREKPKHFVQ